MQTSLIIRILCGVCLLGLGRKVLGEPSACPSSIYPTFCDSLLAMGDGDWRYCRIIFDGPHSTDTACNKTQQDCRPAPGSVSDTTPPAYIIEYTRELFGTYDLRWPDDTANRAPVPVAGGRWDTVGGQYHSPNSIYVVWAKKGTILSVAAEPYVLFVEPWSPQIWVSLSHPKRQPSRTFTVPFNIKGQRMPSIHARTYLVPGFPAKPKR